MPAGPSPSAQASFDIPSLNGVRAIAVLVVFVGHGFTIGGPWPGDVGVTIFFFLSGYLITTLLRREYTRTGRISLGKFYLRRLLRIQPPALITIALCVAVGLTGLTNANMTVWGVLAEVFNYTNYYMMWADVNLGDARAGLPPESSMLWSLAVEEHFYLVFPAVFIALLWRKLNFRTIGWVLVGACLLAPIWRIYLAANGASFFHLYSATDTRFDGLLAGAAMALLANPALGDRGANVIPPRILAWAVAPVAAVAVAVIALTPPAFGLTVGDTIIYACLVPLFWFIITQPQSGAGRVLNHRWVVRIGLLSFSIYLLHRLVLAIVETVIPIAPVVDVLSLVIVIAAAQVMYMVVEKPLGKLRKSLEARMPEQRREAPEPAP
jgi:peptidoglycan/LPS O-acetylase OafA/YrhL